MSCAGSLATLPRPHWVEMSCIAALALCATRYATKCFGFAVFGGVSGGAEHVLICVSKGFGVTIVKYEFRGLSGHFGSRGFGFEHSILLHDVELFLCPLLGGGEFSFVSLSAALSL